MNDLLDHPALQGGVVPFFTAAVVAMPLARTRFLAIAVVAGLLALLHLTIGFALEPLTLVRKMILATLAITAVAVAIEATGAGRRVGIAAALAAVAGLAAVWVLQRILEQKEPASAWLLGVAAWAYVALIVGGVLAISTHPLRVAVVGALLGWGSGALAMLGASAVLGLIGIALGTASAAVVVVQLLRASSARVGWTLALPVAIGASCVGVLAVATGELRWYLPLLLIAPAALLVPAGRRAPLQEAFLWGVAGLLPVAVALAWAWRAATSGAGAG